jgi:hypothetical protein
MLNREIYTKAPEENRLVNNGVAEVSEDYSDAAEAVLRYEVETFVCNGQYALGLETILEKFLLNLNSGSEQPGVWISGFYGSGKSHLAKMLRILWTDFQFKDGATARGLAKLPVNVKDLLKELSTQAKRHGGLHGAAGKLGAGAGDNVRLALLGIIFKSKRLPEQYHQARFLMWLRSEGLLSAVEDSLRAAKRSLAQELPHMYVSTHLGKALLNVRKGFADTELAARQFLRAQFPQVTDVTNDQLIAAVTEAASVDEKFPLTLVVLDEIQQYIGSDAEKAYLVQEITESLCKHFSGRLLFVGTGQSALSGMPNLMRLMGRFPVSITLGDWDVENVTRQIILAKKPSAQPAVEKVWRDNLGEISRHLRGTKLEHITDDELVLTADYPVLPVRRRVWERVLRTIDTTGTVSQLRSQLGVVHAAVLATAKQPLGHVVTADFLYDQIAHNLVSTAQLPKEVFENVARLGAGDENAKIKAKLLKLIFLINKLPPEAALDTGLKATDDALADLLVEDVAGGSTNLRTSLPQLLKDLQNKDRLIMAISGADGTEYRLQTRESSAWYDEFRAHEAELKAAPQRVEVERSDLLKTRFRELLKNVRVMQGRSNEVRTLTATFDDTLPKDHDRDLYIWIQDGWQNDENSVIAEAKSKPADDPNLFVFLPAQNKSEITNEIVALEAAKATLRKKGTPSTEEGRDAQRSMESRQRNAEKRLSELLDTCFANVRVFQSGGQEVTEGSDLNGRLNHAAAASAIRLYKEFDVADHDRWDKVLEEARKGNLEALKFVGHSQDVDKHPVCQKLLAFIGAGKKGGDIRDNFDRPPFGWSRDAIDGVLYLLLATGHIRAVDAGGKSVDARGLDRNKLTQATFRQESITITPVQKIKIRAFFSNFGVPCQPNEELNKAPQLIAKLRELANRAGGAAPAPEVPKLALIDSLEGQSGNALLLELFNRADELTRLGQQWQQTAAAIHARLPFWAQLLRLLPRAADLSGYEQLSSERDAVTAQRSLLKEPDPIGPLLERVTDALRKALNAKYDAYTESFRENMAALAMNPDWQRLSETQRNELIERHHLQALTAPDLASADQIEDALDECSLRHWIAKIEALPIRFDAARRSAVELLKPNVVHVSLPRRTLTNDEELKAWLREVESLLTEKLKQGPVAL